ncbi:MAG: ABC transporter ATP-binding protein [Anaerolineae bacterium]|nr:ABC transporter ATP-binding protein [Anaerolineae bacterium]
MLEINNLEVVYSSVVAVLRGVTLNVPDGQIVTLMGPNGAGKSTTMKAISGLLRVENGEVTRGQVLWKGQQIQALATEEIVRQGIIQVIEGRPLFRQLTVEENLRLGAMVYRQGREVNPDLERVYHYFPRLKAMHQRASGYLSGGEQQMLVIGRALMGHPQLILLDEPSLGLAPLLVQEIFSIVRNIRDEAGLAVLLVEQNAHAALGVADDGYVMENGRIVLGGSAEALRANPKIQELYLGLSEIGERRSYREARRRAATERFWS